MKAFVSYINPLTCRDELGTGLQWVTPEYKSVKELNYYFLTINPTKPAARYHVQAYKNWNNRYGTPDYDYVFDKETCTFE